MGKTTFLGITISAIAVTAILLTSIITQVPIQDAQVETLDFTGHGYAGPEIFNAYADDDASVKEFTLIADEDDAGTLLPTGDRIHTMTFNGQMPAPTLRVTEGDIVKITIINEGDEVHSIDQHASQITAVPNFGAVPPISCIVETGDPDCNKKTYTFVAANPGVFAYHCEGDDVFDLDKHALLGMEGMLIVDPKDGYEELETDSIIPFEVTSNVASEEEEFDGPAREFSLVYSESYFTDDLKTIGEGEHGTPDSVDTPHKEHVYDKSKMMRNDPTYTHANGVPFGYLGPLLSLPRWQSESLADVIPGEFLLDCTFTGASTPIPPGILSLEDVFCNDPDGDGTDENNPPLFAVTTVGADQGTPEADSLEEILGFIPFGPGTITSHLDVNSGDHVRFFLQNTGNRQVAWHIVGEQLDRVTMGTNVMTESPIQTWNIGPYQDATIDVVFEQPGVYAIVNHDYSSLFKGQASIVVVHEPTIDPASCAEDDLVCIVISGAAVESPSNAVPPASDLEDTSMEQDTCAYGIGAVTANTFTSECFALDVQNT